MFRLIAFLLAALGTTMYFADDIAGPADHKKATGIVLPDLPAVQAVELKPVVAHQIKREPERAAEPVAFQADTSIRQPTEHRAGYVPFLQPAVVNRDGSIAVPVFVAVTASAVESTQPESESEPTLKILYVTAKRVNVRQGPSTGHQVLGEVVFAEAVQVLSDPAKEWVVIRIEGAGVEGYMASRFLQAENPQG